MTMLTILRHSVTILCLGLSGFGLASSNLDLPDLGDSGMAVMSPSQEKRTGAAVVRNLRRAGLIIDDPLLTDYLNQLGYRLLSHHEHNQQTRFEFFLVNDPTINAFALPGGFIGVHYGLFRETESESELASVIAHEIAHVTQRHYARAFNSGSNTELPMLAAIIAAIVIGNQSGNGELGQAVLATAAASQIQSQINFTRQNEYEADRVGIGILSRAGYDPEKMADFFDKLDRASRIQGYNLPEFLRTHPVNENRIADARNRARVLPKPTHSDSLAYHLMRQRIHALASDDKLRSEKQYQEDIAKLAGDARIAARYGYALNLMRQEKFSAAQSEIDALIAAYPHRIAFLLAKAEIEYRSGQTQKALTTYQEALKLYPDNASIIYDYAEVLLKTRHYRQAEQLLSAFLKKPARNPVFYKFQAETQSALNRPAQSHEAMAEYYYQIGQFHQAIDQIKLALKSTKSDFYTTSRLEARLVHIQEEIPRDTEYSQ